METTITTSRGTNSWEIVPGNTVAGIVLFVLFLYLFVRHFIFFLMIMDVIVGWLRRFRWFPTKGKRLKAFVHWIIAIGLFAGFQFVGGQLGWLEFVPQ